jgi:hypothetical protein
MTEKKKEMVGHVFEIPGLSILYNILSKQV